MRGKRSLTHYTACGQFMRLNTLFVTLIRFRRIESLKALWRKPNHSCQINIPQTLAIKSLIFFIFLFTNSHNVFSAIRIWKGRCMAHIKRNDEIQIFNIIPLNSPTGQINNVQIFSNTNDWMINCVSDCDCIMWRWVCGCFRWGLK